MKPTQNSLYANLKKAQDALNAKTGKTTALPTLNTTSLQSQKPFDIPQQAPSTAVQGELARFQANTDQYTQNLSDQRSAKEESANTSFQDFISSQLNAPTETGLQSDIYGQKGGVDSIQGELDKINQDIRAEQVALMRRQEALEKNPQGLFQGALQDEMARIERDSLRKQADLSIIQQGIQGRYDSAKAIADRAIDAEMEVARREIDLRGLIYERNQDLFTQAEQREFQTIQDNRKRALDREEANLKEISNISLDALQNGAPPAIASQMRNAKSVDEAMQIGGQYVGLQTRLTAQANRENARIERLTKLAELGQPAAIKALGIPDSTGNEPSDDLVAFAAEYAATGKKPTSIPKNLSFGEIAEYARSLPKAPGTLVNVNTGIKDGSLGAAEQEDLKRLYNITNMIEDLKKYEKESWQGVIGGTFGKIFGSESQGSYVKTRKAIVDEISRMQTGAALTKDEQTFYEDYLPGRFAEPFNLGQDPDDVIADFEKLMNDKLNSALSNNQLSIYGYSKVGDYKVGETIKNANGQTGIVNPDGTVTIVP